jgi:hypothetical protein
MTLYAAEAESLSWPETTALTVLVIASIFLIGIAVADGLDRTDPADSRMSRFLSGYSLPSVMPPSTMTT